jgi:hypothetical protein
MIVLLLIAAWIVVLSLVMGLCAAARVGDVAQLTHASAPAGRVHAEPAAWESSGHLEIAVRANVRPVRPAESGAALVHSDGVAA